MYQMLHQKWARLAAGVFGEQILAVTLNLFIVPLGLYSGGVMGACQLVRTLLQTFGGMDFGTTDIAGILYFLANIPILLLAWRNLGRPFVLRTIVCTVAYTAFYSLIPTPAEPIIGDYLTACMLGGILYGIGGGIVLTCGCSDGGLNVVGLVLSKRGSQFTVGRFSLLCNGVLYAICLLLFFPEIAIYSVIFNFTSALVLDRVHQQNISIQALIYTRADVKELSQAVIHGIGRGVTYWEGVGAYTGEGLHVLSISLSRYEQEELLRIVQEVDPRAFITLQAGTHVYGNFLRKME